MQAENYLLERKTKACYCRNQPLNLPYYHPIGLRVYSELCGESIQIK